MSEEFKVLSDREHTLLRPGVYIGSTTPEPQTGFFNFEIETKKLTPGLLKIIYEVLDNAVDEYIRTVGKFANKIDVSIQNTLEGSTVKISDNGRGIPQELIGESPRAVLAWTALRAGSNFDDSKRIGIGTNGMGVALTNIFSKEFTGTTCDGKNTLILTCFDNMSSVNWKTRKGGTQGTTVEILPDYTRFGLTDVNQDHVDAIKDRLINLAISYREIQFSFNGEPIKFKTTKDILKNLGETIVSVEENNVLLAFAPMGNRDSYVLSYINGLKVINGGTHVDYIMGKIVESIRGVIKKKHKIDVPPSQIKPHILFASWLMNVPKLAFDSQTKERVTNPISEISAFLKDVDFEKLAKKIVATDEIINPIVEAILHKRDLEEARELAKKAKDAKKIKIADHIAATHPDPSKRMLLLTEGDSASGPGIAVRDPKIVGFYPLRGKPLNVNGMRLADIAKNQEMFDLMQIIGLKFGEPAENLNYGMICCFSDADLDGNHVTALLLNFFAIWPELFTNRKIYRLRAPLYSAKNGKETKLFYTQSEYEDAQNGNKLRGFTIKYLKGLGSMSIDAYEQCIKNPKLECFVDLDLGKLQMTFGKDTTSRKEWMLT